MDDKTKSILAHLPFIGWIIAYFMNQTEKGPDTSFYLRQTLGLNIFLILGMLLGSLQIPFLSIVWIVLVIILLIMSLLNALAGTQKTVPVAGEMFQHWFRGIN